jgi:DNA-binding PadR family transcriptional regulator
VEVAVAVAGGYAFEEEREGSSVTRRLRSPVARAVLGLVIEKPSYGYEIDQRFRGRFGLLLQAEKSSIYRTLNRLAGDGLIEAMPLDGVSVVRRGAKVGPSYRATAEGARAYRALLADEVRTDPRTADLLGRFMLAAMSSVDAALEFLDSYEQSCVQDAAALAPPGLEAAPPAEVVGVVQRLLLDKQRRAIDADLAWISYAKAELRAERARAVEASR